MRLLLALLLVCALPAWAACTDTGVNVNADTCSSADVSACFSVVDAGDTINIPAGTCNWTSSVSSGTLPANVTILGAGSLSTRGGNDVTIIQDNISGGSPVLSLTPASTGSFRLAGITIRGGTGAIKESGMLAIGGSNTGIVVDHVHVNKITYSPANSGKLLYLSVRSGVIYESKFSCGANEQCWIHIVNGTGSQGNQSWADPTGFGGSDFIFLEDNDYLGDYTGDGPPLASMTDCHTSGRYVARFNNVVMANIGQTHPTGHAGGDRGCRAHEIYGNTVSHSYAGSPGDVEQAYSMEYNNSGPALIWGNDVEDGTYKHFLYFNVIRSNNDTYGQTATPGGWGYCGTAFNGTGSNWDRNDSASLGRPCLDQPGRGVGDLIVSDFPTKLNNRTGTIAYPEQALEPVYEWLHTGDVGPGWGPSWLTDSSGGRLSQNQDYYLHHGNTSCNAGAGSCTAGVGVGTLAQRPANCTTGSESGGGVAWWATDQGGNWNTVNGTSNDGMLYKCTATNTWTQHYTPYEYPHPLRDDTASPPDAPTNLRVIGGLAAALGIGIILSGGLYARSAWSHRNRPAWGSGRSV